MLIVGTAVAFGLMRLTDEYTSMMKSMSTGDNHPPIFTHLIFIQWRLGHTLLGLGLSQMVLRLLRPRPTIRVAIRQAGFLASAAVVLACLFKVVFQSWTYFFYTRNSPIPNRLYRWGGLIFVDDPETVVPVLCAAWLTLLVVGRWRPATDWVDSLGRWVGWCWFATVPIFLGHRYLL